MRIKKAEEKESERKRKKELRESLDDNKKDEMKI